MKNFSIILSVIAVIVAAAALINSRASQNQVNISAEQVASILNENPKMVIDAFNSYQEQQRAEAEKAAMEAMQKYIPDLVSTENALYVGPEDAKITVVEFFDFSCGYCKRLAPELEKTIAANGDVKFIFKPLTFLGSAYQAKGAYAAANQGKFIEYYTAVMAANGRLNEASVDAIAEKIGLDMEQFKADLAADKVVEKLGKIAELADNLQVRGVPSVFVNGKPAHAMNADELQKIIDEAK